MPLTTFTYVPSKGFTKNVKPKVRAAQFGDGYSQRVPDGIHNMAQEWSLNFTSRGLTEANTIVSFFEDKKACTAFYWTPPGESTALTVICPEWSKTYDSHISASITAKFVQVFDAV